MEEKLVRPDYLFEVSWEVCNKVGGIHTVISTKASTLYNELSDNYILIGPDVWRDTERNPEFAEDQQLFAQWRSKAMSEGIRVRIGRWNVVGNPIAIMVDFTPFFSQKNEIFKFFWDQFKLDSLSGQWDYVEPALFGYAAGKVIESFTRHQLSLRHRVVAQFHEWMTGTGLLYLKSTMPQIGTIFTTHATVLGRSIAGNGQPLYDNLEKYDPDAKAKEFNVISKQSLEKVSAVEADCYTTVSNITAKECAQFHKKEVDLVTPNGFEDRFVPEPEEFNLRRIEAKVKCYEVAEALLAHDVSKNSLLIGIGGRYEFKNKGIDIFIDALGELNRSNSLDHEVLAFIMIPANHHGPRKDVFKNLQEKSNENILILSDTHLTHYLIDPEYDPILNRIKSAGLLNASTDKVKIFFVPCYLNGTDGIFNLHYYDLLIGMDLSIFPSYYEPWGYTPLESLAFHVPTITTTLAGFGLWVNTHMKEDHPGSIVINRTDSNDTEVVQGIVKAIKSMDALERENREFIRDDAYKASKIALWENLIQYYYQAYDIALRKTENRTQLFVEKEREEEQPIIERKYELSQPQWVRVMVQKSIPQKLSALDELSKNLWWSWNPNAVELFQCIDSDLWEKSEQNPIALLEQISLSRFRELEENPMFMSKLNSVYDEFTSYMNKKQQQTEPCVAYFSMEFGLHVSLKTYSGGLGILAGDYLKEASDQNVRIVGIGLLYKYGYFTQQLSSTGQQVNVYDSQNFAQSVATPVREADGTWKTISIAFPGRNVNARIWRVDVGRTELYLLDTEMEENQPADRSITHQLYGGDWENRLKQEMLLGIGGIRALAKLGIRACVYHLNEGHAAFTGLERLRELILNDKLSFNESLEVVRASSLFTTHTPVPAGHDSFPEDMIRTYMAHYPDRLKITWEQFMDLGRLIPGNRTENFSMSYLATNLAQEVNGVSELHGKVSREMFAGLWPGYFPSELHVSHVTNGVHYPTWTSGEWRSIMETENRVPVWEKITETPNALIWKTKTLLRKRLLDNIRLRLSNPHIIKYESPKNVIDIKENLRDDALTIGFARRFATYKRAHLLLRDLKRLSRIVNNPDKPVQFIFAGKAHPNDKAGQDLIKRIVEISKNPEFIGKVLFLQNYDSELARVMVQGVDIWMNTPTRPLEASGTSGMKAVMNGTLHFSVLDGWWVEAYKPNAGWALPEERTYSEQEFQDDLDAETIYNLLENEIVPAFFDRDEESIPQEWVGFIKKSITEIAPAFSSTRMLNDYQKQFYTKLLQRSKDMVADDFEMAKNISAWKKKVSRSWDSIEVISVKPLDGAKEPMVQGLEYTAEAVIYLDSLQPNDIGVELVVASPVNQGEVKILGVIEFDMVNFENGRATYQLKFSPNEPGAFDSGIRIFGKNPLLPHRMDFPLMRWI